MSIAPNALISRE